jgi:hypothetical protein
MEEPVRSGSHSGDVVAQDGEQKVGPPLQARHVFLFDAHLGHTLLRQVLRLPQIPQR